MRYINLGPKILNFLKFGSPSKFQKIEKFLTRPQNVSKLVLLDSTSNFRGSWLTRLIQKSRCRCLLSQKQNFRCNLVQKVYFLVYFWTFCRAVVGCLPLRVRGVLYIFLSCSVQIRVQVDAILMPNSTEKVSKFSSVFQNISSVEYRQNLESTGALPGLSNWSK